MARVKGSRNRRVKALSAAVKTLSESGMTQTAISEHLHIAPKTVKELIQAAKDTLEAESVGVLQDWRTAASMGALKGNHTPARDWLLHAGIIQPLAQDKPTGPQILIGIASLPGLPTVQTGIDSTIDARVLHQIEAGPSQKTQ